MNNNKLVKREIAPLVAPKHFESYCPGRPPRLIPDPTDPKALHRECCDMTFDESGDEDLSRLGFNVSYNRNETGMRWAQIIKKADWLHWVMPLILLGSVIVTAIYCVKIIGELR